MMDLVVSASNSKKRNGVVSHACTFCKKRHLKCNGQSPCDTCLKKGIHEYCSFEKQGKRGRKSSKGEDSPPQEVETQISTNLMNELLRYKKEAEFWRQQYVSEHQKVIQQQLVHVSAQPLQLQNQLSAINHDEYFRFFHDKMKPMLPFFNVVETNVMTNFDEWDEVVSISMDSYKSGRPDFLCDALQYVLLCGLGATAYDAAASKIFFAKAEQLVYLLVFVESGHHSPVTAEITLNLLLMMKFYCWIFMPCKVSTYANVVSFVWHTCKINVPTGLTHRIFLMQSACTPRFKERIGWLIKLKGLPSPEMTYPICLFSAFLVSVFFSSKYPTVLNEESQECMQHFLDVIQQADNPERTPLQKISLMACRAKIYHFLNSMGTSLNLAYQVLQMFATIPSIDLSTLYALGFSLEIIKGITGEVPADYVGVLEKYQREMFPSLRVLLYKIYTTPTPQTEPLGNAITYPATEDTLQLNTAVLSEMISSGDILDKYFSGDSSSVESLSPSSTDSCPESVIL